MARDKFLIQTNNSLLIFALQVEKIYALGFMY